MVDAKNAAALIATLAALGRNCERLDLAICDRSAIRLVYVMLTPWLTEEAEEEDEA
jgi:hypothetical protein